MNRKHVKHSRPSTVWVDKSSFCHEELSSKSTASPDTKPSPSYTMTATAVAPGSTKLRMNNPDARISCLNQNPWDTFEPIAGLQDRSLIFARHRKIRGHLVHIQQIEQQFTLATSLLELMEQIFHPSFLTLLECYHHGTSCTLIWEPTEVSVSHILASSCSITTDGLVGIIKPVSQIKLL
jgi:hypothetical protein